MTSVFESFLKSFLLSDGFAVVSTALILVIAALFFLMSKSLKRK